MVVSLPTINVITIVKDDNSGLRRTLNSLSAQNTTGIKSRILVVDGSTESATSEVIHRAHNLDVTTIYREPRGIYNAMNEGIIHLMNNSLDENSFIVFLNAGDFFVDSDALIKICQENLRSNLVVGNAVMLDLRTKPSVIYPQIVFGSGDYFMHPNVFWMPHQGLSARASVFFQVGLFDENYKIAGDYDWIFRAVKAFGIPSLIPDILVAQMIDGISHFRAFSGYRERQYLARFHNLKVDKLPASLIIKLFVKEFLSARDFFWTISLSKQRSEVLDAGMVSDHKHETRLLCAWCYFESYSSWDH